jgi:ABC-type glycerol-3-phosphate transport system substrate-binding protein
MLAQNRIPRSVVDFDAPADYIQQVVDGRADLAIITTDQLGRLRGAGLAYASVPNSTGAPATLMDGWVWVIVTPTPEQQSMSGRFINWMMDAERHSAYADQIAMPPSLRGSLRRWGFEGLDNALLESLLADSPVVMPEVTTSSAARALQSALLSVLSGDASAAEAAAAALTP